VIIEFRIADLNKISKTPIKVQLDAVVNIEALPVYEWSCSMIKSRISFGAFSFVYLYILKSSESRFCWMAFWTRLDKTRQKAE